MENLLNNNSKIRSRFGFKDETLLACSLLHWEKERITIPLLRELAKSRASMFSARKSIVIRDKNLCSLENRAYLLMIYSPTKR